jgi:hypothetical protein
MFNGIAIPSPVQVPVDTAAKDAGIILYTKLDLKVVQQH